MKKVRVRQHVNPLKGSFLGRRVEAVPLEPDKRLEVELGCADAAFLFRRAAIDPHAQYVGVEIRHEWVTAVNARAAREGAPVRAVFGHLNEEHRRFFPPGRIARVYVNFPDPWFKRRHHKRRLLDEELVAEVVRTMTSDGELLFQSDVWDLALDAMAVLEAEPGLVNRRGEWSFWKGPNPYGVKSRREEVCEEEGRPIWRIVYDRRR